MGDQQIRCGAGLALAFMRASLDGKLWVALVCAYSVTDRDEPSLIHQMGLRRHPQGLTL